MYPPIVEAVASHDATAFLLGSDPLRFWPFGVAPQNVKAPYAVWQVVSGAPENYLSGRPDLDSFTIQVDCYADSGMEAAQIASAIRDAVELEAHIVRWGGQMRDQDTRKFRVSFDIDWHVPRPRYSLTPSYQTVASDFGAYRFTFDQAMNSQYPVA